jgi:hypothetical protein
LRLHYDEGNEEQEEEGNKEMEEEEEEGRKGRILKFGELN